MVYLPDDPSKIELTYAVKELFFWQYNRMQGDNFHSLLYNLICKADSKNKLKFWKGFPAEMEAMRLWNAASDQGDELFREYGLMK